MRRNVFISVLVLLILGGLNYADQNAMAPNIVLIKKGLNITDSQVGLVGSIYILSVAISMFIFGYLADIYSRKKLILIGALFWSIFAYLTSVANSYHMLLLVRFFTGVGIGSFFPVAFAMVADYFPPFDRGKIYAWMNIIPALGAAGGVAVAAIYGSVYGWGFPFRIIAICGFISIVLFYFLLKEPKKGESEPELERVLKEGEVYDYRINWEAFKGIWKKRTNIYLIAQSIPGSVPWGIITTWMITFFVVTYNMPILLATIFSASFLAGCGFGAIIGGYLGDSLEKKYATGRVTLCVMGQTGVLVLLTLALLINLPVYNGTSSSFGNMILEFIQDYLLKTKAGWIFDLYFVAGIFAGFAAPNMGAMAVNVNFPEVRGTVWALNLATNLIGRGAGPLIGGILGEALGLKNALIFASLFFIFSVILFIPTYWTKPYDEMITRKELAIRAKSLKEEVV